jgi:hypothetical protein
MPCSPFTSPIDELAATTPRNPAPPAAAAAVAAAGALASFGVSVAGAVAASFAFSMMGILEVDVSCVEDNKWGDK